MKPSESLVLLVLLVASSIIYIPRIDQASAVQELQLREYRHIVLTNYIHYAAFLRSDCKFGEYSRLTFEAYPPNSNQLETISVCIGIWEKPTIHTP